MRTDFLCVKRATYRLQKCVDLFGKDKSIFYYFTSHHRVNNRRACKK
jgi:hypothetical protein